MDTENGISFILPTRNRVAVLRRAVESCISLSSHGIDPLVIVIDGGSSDGSLDDMRTRYNGDRRVQLVSQCPESSGFMNACFLGTTLVHTKFVTFMYDDDVLSPFIATMYAPVLENRAEFVMGFGRVGPVDEVIKFRPLPDPVPADPITVLEQYFGARDLPYTAVPVSPICCLTTLDHLQEWDRRVQQFASRGFLRRHLMLGRNIGPDLMLYMTGLLRSTGGVSVCYGTVAQFSTHPDSMTVRFDALDLDIGYWLARLSVFQDIVGRGDTRLAAACGGYLLARGAAFILGGLASRKFRYVTALVGEVRGLTTSLLGARLMLPALRRAVADAVRRATRGPTLTSLLEHSSIT